MVTEITTYVDADGNETQVSAYLPDWWYCEDSWSDYMEEDVWDGNKYLGPRHQGETYRNDDYVHPEQTIYKRIYTGKKAGDQIEHN